MSDKTLKIDDRHFVANMADCLRCDPFFDPNKGYKPYKPYFGTFNPEREQVIKEPIQYP